MAVVVPLEAPKAEREWEMPVAQQTTVKTAHHRLLDMVAAWSHFVYRDEEKGIMDTPGINEAIYGVYQAAGSLGLEENPVDENSEAVIRDFVLARILPILLNKD